MVGLGGANGWKIPRVDKGEGKLSGKRENGWWKIQRNRNRVVWNSEQVR